MRKPKGVYASGIGGGIHYSYEENLKCWAAFPNQGNQAFSIGACGTGVTREIAIKDLMEQRFPCDADGKKYRAR